jgi:hypothetical protein
VITADVAVDKSMAVVLTVSCAGPVADEDDAGDDEEDAGEDEDEPAAGTYTCTGSPAAAIRRFESPPCPAFGCRTDKATGDALEMGVALVCQPGTEA